MTSLFTDSAGEFFRSVVKATVALIIVFAISWEVGIAIFITLIFYTIIYWIRFKADIPYAKKMDTLFDKELSKAWEVIPQARVTKMFNNEDLELRKVDQLKIREKGLTIKKEKLWNNAKVAEVFFVSVPTITIRFYAAWLAFQGRFGLPSFVLLYSMVETAQDPLWIINWFIWEMQNAYNRAKKYIEILESKEKINDPLNPKQIRNPLADIEFEKVSFKYESNDSVKENETRTENVLHDIGLVFKGGQITALVGKSGSGKTTITSLIGRFYDPIKGRITLDGISLKDFRKKDLRDHIGFVMQESFVFSGTIADNLRYARPDATKEELIQSLKKANAWGFVKVCPKGLDTEIGERGIKLSGGQKQRMSIARAILKNPEILILDEATNALDSESEMLVQDALERFMKDRTVIIIAHRLSTVHLADNIYLIGNGKVLESGNHERLIKKEGIYKKLYDIQSGNYEKEKRLMEEYEMI